MVRCVTASTNYTLPEADVGIGTLLAMLITYLAQGRPHYPSEDGSIAYISDVGADILKPLFVTGCAITGMGFFLSLVIERWLRHSGRCVTSRLNVSVR